MLLGPPVAINCRPFGETATQLPTRRLRILLPRFLGRDGAVVQRQVPAHVIGDSENQKTKIHQQRQHALTGDFRSPSPSTGGTEHAANLAIDFPPRCHHHLVPEALHFPTQQTHVCRAAKCDSIAPDHILRGGLIHGPQSNLRPGDASRPLRDKGCHACGVTGF